MIKKNIGFQEQTFEFKIVNLKIFTSNMMMYFKIKQAYIYTDQPNEINRNRIMYALKNS